MAHNPNPAPARICVGCLQSVSVCSCLPLDSPAIGTEYVPRCRCGRYTCAPNLRGLAELAKSTAAQGLAEGDPLVSALAGVPDPIIVEPSPERCGCGRELNGWKEPACRGCFRLPSACSCAPLDPSPRRVCLDCTFNDPKIAAVAAHVRLTHHRIDLALVESSREASTSGGSFLERLQEAQELGERQAALLAGLSVDREAFQHGPTFVAVLDGALGRSKRQREFLRALVAARANPGARLVLEGGRPVVHVPAPVTVEELGAVELSDVVELGSPVSPPPAPEDLEKTEIRPAPTGEEVHRG